MKDVQTKFGWLGAVLAIIGTVLNTQMFASCFIFWFISNVIMVIIGVRTKMWFVVAQFSFLAVMSVYGFFNWLKILI